MVKDNQTTININSRVVSINLEDNINFLSNVLSNCAGIASRRLCIQDIQIYIIYSERLIDKLLLTEGILKNISNIKQLSIEKIFNELPIGNVELIKNLEDAIDRIFLGEAIIFMEGNVSAATISIPKYIESKESQIELSILGNKDAFTNVLAMNIILLRGEIPDSELEIHSVILGIYSKTNINVVCMKSIANPKIVEEIMKRLKSVDIDMILDSTNIAELIEDAPYSPFPTVNLTERIDKVIGCLKDGQVAILVDKTPFVLIAPAPFESFFQVSEDYYMSFYISSLIRILRYISYFSSVFIPGFYIAITNYNHELIPIRLLITFSLQRKTLPFPPVVEILLMLVAFELLRELGMRLPKTIGATISLVGALIIGEIAVKAGFVSATVVIISAFTSICSMIIPSTLLYESLILCRLLCLILSSILGFFGLLISFILVLGHLVTIRTFGIPYTYPLSPYNKEDMDDILMRAPIWKMKEKPTLFSKMNIGKFRRKIK